MKKFLAVLLLLGMCLGLGACGSKDASGGGEIDMGKYPASLEEWTGQNFIDYFTEAGIFSDGNGAETWLQNHMDYWPGTPVNECAGWWRDDGMDMAMILILSPDNGDTSQEQMDEWLDAFRETKTLPGEYSGVVTIDALAGNVAFTYNTIMDEELYGRMEAACKELLEALGTKSEI